jgi:hypothetical protein
MIVAWISKYLTQIIIYALIASVVGGVAVYLWNDYQGAKERATRAETALITANAETVEANAATMEVAEEYGKREEEINAKIKRAAEFRRRAMVAEKKYRNLAASGDTYAINVQLCKTFDDIEGGNSADREARCSASGPAGNVTGKVYRIEERYVSNILSNFERCNTLTNSVFKPPQSDVPEVP